MQGDAKCYRMRGERREPVGTTGLHFPQESWEDGGRIRAQGDLHTVNVQLTFYLPPLHTTLLLLELSRFIILVIG